MKKLQWGILSTAKIGREKVIPAIQKSQYGEVVAIASRSQEQAAAIASSLDIPNAYATYEELLGDSAVEAVYIPLPNHLHVEWAIKALEAGKHVLCEKPLGVSATDAQRLLSAAAERPQLYVMEAFMYRFHPQWQAVKKHIDEKRIGEVKAIQSFFSYFNVDLNNIRNRKEAAGGALLDIGCYCISWSRWIFGEEPLQVVSVVDTDPRSQTDRLTAGLLQFSDGVSSFTCSTQLMPYQRVNILGAEGRIEVDIPVNAPAEKQVKITVHLKSGSEEILFDAVDQYTLQCDAFSKAVLKNTPLSVTLQDALQNMKVIDAFFESAVQNGWVQLR